jgi:hypothetical protein
MKDEITDHSARRSKDTSAMLPCFVFQPKASEEYMSSQMPQPHTPWQIMKILVLFHRGSLITLNLQLSHSSTLLVQHRHIKNPVTGASVSLLLHHTHWRAV